MKLSHVLSFIIGAGIGSAVTYILVKQHCEDEANEHINEELNHAYEQIEKRYGKQEEVENETSEKTEEEKTSDIRNPDAEMMAYASNIKKLNYAGYFVDDPEAPEQEEENSDYPKIITKDQFGDTDYTLEYLTYYADGALVDDMDDIVDNIDSVVGLSNLREFETEGQDEIFIRNDIRRCDYDIVFSENNYYMEN